MSEKIFKNHVVNLGSPFQIKAPINFDTIKKINVLENVQRKETGEEMLVRAREEYEMILAQAREEADMIMREAKLESERFMEQAREQAFRESAEIGEEAQHRGYEEGMIAAQQQYEDLMKEAELIRDNAKVEYREVLAGIETDAVNTVLEVARKVIGMELSFNSEDILYIVRQGFEKCSNKENVVLKVSSGDYDFVVENRERLMSMVEGLGELEIKKDASLKAGGCLIETMYGCVDAGVQTKMDKIEEAFLKLIKE